MKPMLATDAVVEKLRFPILASVDVAGLRVVVRNGIVLDEKLLEIDDDEVQRFGRLEGYDGVVSFTGGRSNGVGVAQAETFYAWDRWDLPPGTPFSERIRGLNHSENVEIVPCTRLYDVGQLKDYAARALAAGYRGLMLRYEDSAYVFGRSSLTQGSLLRYVS